MSGSNEFFLIAGGIGLCLALVALWLTTEGRAEAERQRVSRESLPEKRGWSYEATETEHERTRRYGGTTEGVRWQLETHYSDNPGVLARTYTRWHTASPAMPGRLLMLLVPGGRNDADDPVGVPAPDGRLQTRLLDRSALNFRLQRVFGVKHDALLGGLYLPPLHSEAIRSRYTVVASDETALETFLTPEVEHVLVQFMSEIDPGPLRWLEVLCDQNGLTLAVHTELQEAWEIAAVVEYGVALTQAQQAAHYQRDDLALATSSKPLNSSMATASNRLPLSK